MKLTRLGRFEILQEIGKGAMGRVFLANDPKIERRVAIKTISLPPGTSEQEARETSERFLREAQAAGKLMHPNIVTVFDVGEDSGVSFIAMEYIEGDTLERYTRPDSLLPPGRILDLATQAASALDYAHRHRVVHRDIKPANLMILKDGTLKITDFGLAKNPSASLTQAGVLLGTPSYMSPEQIRGRELDGRSDLFSLAVVLYELLTGARAFDGDSISTIIYRVLYEEPRPPASYNPALPPDVNAILEKGLAKSPEDRYATGADLAGALGRAFSALPPETLRRPFPGVGRRPSDPTAPGARRDPAIPGRAARRPRAGSQAPPPGARSGGRGAGPTLFAHHPGKIAAVLLIAAAGLIVFPRWANRPEWARDGASGEASPPEAAVLTVSPAAIGGAPAEAPLPRGPSQVAIEVSTIPHGGRVFLDSIPLAEPRVVLSMIDTQEHDIMARAGCRQAVAAMTAADLASFDGPLVMELGPRKEKVRIGSRPSGARIYLNRRDTGKVTPASVTLEACAEREVRLRRRGYRDWTGQFDADTDFDAMIETLREVPLEPIPSGTVLIAAPEEYAVEILEGGKRIGKAGMPVRLLEGKHDLTFRNEKYFMSKRLRVTVRGNSRSAPLVSFPGLGSLTVHAQPSNCKVYVDGRYVDVTPVIDRPIAAGGHHVKVVFVPNGTAREIPVTVDAGENSRVVVKF
ncbi:MAG: protein kinase [Gemmatimonadota bacterium]